MTGQTPQEKAKNYLSTAALYQLGHLPTEQQNPKTMNLSDLSRTDLARAIHILQEIDIDALSALHRRSSQVERLRLVIRDTLLGGGKIFLCGCGATGRLSLSLESFWRETRDGTDLVDRVVSFMAGGDIALVRAAENFEDYPDFGARHLTELGFKNGDLLLAITEGGETPYVIGAALAAKDMSEIPPWFLYCNPDSALVGSIERSRKVIEDSGIEKLNLETGPMAISGSTRLQASTVLMYSVGLALLEFESEEKIADVISRYIEQVHQAELDFLVPFIERESELYGKGHGIFYQTDVYEITVLTDTTERHPTFSLQPFENSHEPEATPSLSYLYLPHARNTEDGWFQTLKRKPRALDWEGYGDRLGLKKLYGYDFSVASVERRKSKFPENHFFKIDREGLLMRFRLNEIRGTIPIHRMSLLEEHLMLKMCINILSTLVMARMGRVEGNVMSWVKPSNGKLIDRTIRYVQMLYKSKNPKKTVPSYEDICEKLFVALETFKGDESIVLKVLSQC